MELLNITGPPYSDTSIEDYQFHTYQPYILGNLNYNNEIRKPIQEMDAYTAPCKSFLYIEGKLVKEDDFVSTKLLFVNNAIAYVFRETRYELNGVVNDSLRNVEVDSTIKNYMSFSEYG